MKCECYMKYECFIDGKYVREFVNAHVAMWWVTEMRKEGKNASYKMVKRYDA